MSLEPPSRLSEAEYSYRTDADLFLLLQNGHTELLAILYDRHAALVYSIGLQLLGNTTEAEDLTQDIFLKLVNKSSYDPKRGTLRTYLSILTRSRALDRLRSRTRSRRQFPNRLLDESAGVSSDSPIEDISQQERSREVREALKRLSSDEQEVLEMAYYQGLSQSQIAERLDIALGTVKSRSRRGLLKLRQALTNLGRQF